jgi:hypothetical protein
MSRVVKKYSSLLPFMVIGLLLSSINSYTTIVQSYPFCQKKREWRKLFSIKMNLTTYLTFLQTELGKRK